MKTKSLNTLATQRSKRYRVLEFLGVVSVHSNHLQYLGFTERVKSVKVDVHHRSERVQLEPEEASTYFHERLLYWKQHDCTQYFLNFVKDVRGSVETLPLLLHSRGLVVSLLLKHLQLPESASLKALLEYAIPCSFAASS